LAKGVDVYLLIPSDPYERLKVISEKI